MKEPTRRALWGRYLDRPWEKIDHADSDRAKGRLLAEYQMAFGSGWVFEWRRR